MSYVPECIGNCTLYLGDCSEVLQQLPENSIDACVTDPPAGIGFMGVGWDTFRGKGGHSRPQHRDGSGEWDYIGSKERARTAQEVARITRKQRNAFIPWLTSIMEQVYRVLKPGAHALVWALPRTSHWTAMACEDAGFEIRDRVSHLFGTGFPKSTNISKNIDLLEYNTWKDIVNSIDNLDRLSIYKSWKQYLKGVNNAGLSFLSINEKAHNARQRIMAASEQLSLFA